MKFQLPSTPTQVQSHGYNLSRETKLGTATELSFGAAITDRCEIKLDQTHEEPSSLLVQPH